MDTATIKENTPRYSGSRPATATAASTKTPSSSGKFTPPISFDRRPLLILRSYVFLRILYHITGVTSPKSRGITKSNTMSNATGRAVLGQPVIDKRRSAYDGKISTSTDKTNQLDNSDAL